MHIIANLRNALLPDLLPTASVAGELISVDFAKAQADQTCSKCNISVGPTHGQKWMWVLSYLRYRPMLLLVDNDSMRLSENLSNIKTLNVESAKDLYVQSVPALVSCCLLILITCWSVTNLQNATEYIVAITIEDLDSILNILHDGIQWHKPMRRIWLVT